VHARAADGNEELRMPVYSYVAMEDDRSLRKGTITADTPRLARDALRARGLRVRRVNSVSSASKREAPPGLATDPATDDNHPHRTARAKSRYAAKCVSFVRELATLLGVGTPLLEAIDAIAEQHAGRFHAVLLMLRDRVAAGATLAGAMREHPDVFDEMCVSITEVGETAGNLEGVLERLAEFKERSQILKDRVGTALLYPLIVFCMAISVSVFLMTFVVPKLLAGLVAAKRQVPLVTRIVKGASDALVNRWWLILIVVAALAALTAAVLRSAAGRRRWHRLQLRIPIVGDMIRKQAIVRMSVIISTLMRSGMVFARAVEIARRATRNQVFRDALQACAIAVERGQDIAPALNDTGAFPRVVVQIFAVGQHSGRLEEMLDRLAADYDRQLATTAQRLTAVLEPVLILLLVILVGFIAFATVLPMLEAANVL
jgi:type II secretory pathway component PulF